MGEKEERDCRVTVIDDGKSSQGERTEGGSGQAEDSRKRMAALRSI